MGKYGYNYRVEIDHWARSYNGDDWVDSSYWLNYNTLNEALRQASSPDYAGKKELIETRVYNMQDSKDLVWKKDWIKNEVVDYTTIPDFDYHNREYD
jgi:hypothetical protein